MDLREEIAQSKDFSLAESDQNKLLNVDSGVFKATSGSLPRFNPFDKRAEMKAKKAAKNVLNPTPLSIYDPKKSVSVKAVVDVQEKEKVVKDKKEEKVVKAPRKETENVKEKVVKDKLDKKEKDKVVKGKNEKEKVVTDKEELQAREVIANVVSDLATEKPKEKSKEKVKSKASKEPQDQHVSKSSKSSKSVKKNASKLLSEAPILRNKSVERDDTPKRKRVVSKADKSKKDTVDIQDSQPDAKKKKAKVQEQEDTVDIQDSQLDVKKKKAKVQEQEDSDDFQDKKKHKLKTKVVAKRKRDDLGSDSSDSEQVVPKRKNLLKKKVAKDESDEDVKVKPKKRGQKKDKELTPEEAKHKEYVSSFQILHARTVPTSLYNAIHQSKQVNMGKFLSEIGFSSFNNLDIYYIPSKLGRYVVSKFDAQTYMLTLENGKSIEVTHAKIHEILGIPTGGISLFSLDYRPDCEFERRWVGQFGSMSLKKIRVKDIAIKLIESKEVDFFFKVNFLTLFINTMGMCAGLKGQINMEVVRRLREDTDISGIDWCDYIHNCLQYSELPSTLLNQYTGPYLFLVLLYMDSTKFERLPIVRTRPAIKNWSSILMGQRQELELKEEVVGMLDLHEDWTEFEVNEFEGFVEGGSSESSFKEELLKKVEEKLNVICNERNVVEECLRKAFSEYPSDLKLLELHQKYSQIFKSPIQLVDGKDVNDGNDDDNDRGGEDENVDRDDNSGNGGNDDDNDGIGEDENVGEDENDKGNDGSKVGLEDLGIEESDQEIDADSEKLVANDVVNDAENQADPASEGNGEEVEITSSPETLTQWIEENVDLIDELTICFVAAEQDYLEGGFSGKDVTPATVEKRVVKPSSYLLSPYVNKKTKVVPKITSIEFILGNSLLAMQGDKIETVFESKGVIDICSVRINMETLAPGLWIDANVIDCWSAILNHEESFHGIRKPCSPLRHFFPTGCISKSMFDGTLSSEDAKFEEFEKEMTAQFKNNVAGLGLDGIDLAFFPIRKAGHFYVVVFSLTKTASMTILDNSDSGATYAEKYETTCELLKTLFARHLNINGHSKHAAIRKAKPRIPKPKWRTKKNFQDCGVFTMLHMETYTGEAATKWDCGMLAESKEQYDMLRRLRFKYATKILLHEINVHAGKMLELATEFDKIPPS